MRTTVDIPESLLRRVKATAALEGSSLKDFLINALETKILLTNNQSSYGRRVSLPLVPSREPGSLKLTNERINAQLEADDVDAFT
ncbi:MAG: hypothetical protein JW841_10445 [Deltaproteobacteria bacterium]|nr:hypothetical protein [Deltaproteobacteria bacterium]